MSKSVQDNLVETAYEEATRVLKNCAHTLGMKASVGMDAYHQVWARDSMITLLGACFARDKKIDRALRASIDTLRKNQTPLGIIPNNVDVKTGKPNFQAYADGGLWFVIGSAIYFENTRDRAFLKKNYPAIKRTLEWYQYQDVHNTSLLSIQEASDWEDLFAVRGRGLYVNVLYHFALREASRIARHLNDNTQQTFYIRLARKVRAEINTRLWYTKTKNMHTIIETGFGTEESLNHSRNTFEGKRKWERFMKKILRKDSYYLPYITFRMFGEWFDSFGNLLAILSGVADKTKAKQILAFVEKYNVALPYPIKAIYPPIFPEKKDWRYYYTYSDLNHPHQYHNGGIWPFLGGFYVAALIKVGKYQKAEKALLSLALLNKKGKDHPWEFNECFHGKSGKPIGMTEQAWSAGMYIYAYECVNKKKPIFF